MYFEGAKLSKSVFTKKLAKRLAMRAKVRVNKNHENRAIEFVEGGAYDEYLKQYKKPIKESNKESKEG